MLADGAAGRPGHTREPLRLAYLVARFPKTTETFVVRELIQIAARDDIDARLLALFEPLPGSNLVHPSAKDWVDRVSRPSWAAGARAFARWLLRRPVTVISTVATLIWGFRAKPRLAANALASMLIGCAHAEQLADEGVAHVHAHFIGNTATAAWVIRRLTGIPYSVTAHAYDLFIDQDFLARRVRDAQFVVAISAFNAQFIVNHCAGRSAPVTVIHAGIDPTAFPFRAPRPRRIPDGAPVRALAVGSLLPRKGHRLLVEALAADDPMLEAIHLTIVGEGEQRAVIETLIRRHALQDRVSLLGAQPEDRVAALLADADLFLLPSKRDVNGAMEGIPVVLMEALASGVPTVATRLSGIPELVEEGVTGTLAEPDEVDSLRAAIRRVLGHPERSAEMARAGRARIERDYDVRRSANALAELFLVGPRR